MKKSREDILADIVSLLQDLSKEWDYTGHMGPQTLLFSELGLESLDAVVLGTALQERYQKEMPFAQLLAEVGQREFRYLAIGELVDFVDTHLASDVKEAQSA